MSKHKDGRADNPRSYMSEMCVSCGRCCVQSPIPILGDDELEKMKSILPLSLSLDDFKKAYLFKIDWEASKATPEAQIFKGKDGRKPLYLMMGEDRKCPFLEGKNKKFICKAYDQRPEACRTFDCLPLTWFGKFLVTGVLTYTARPKSLEEAAGIVKECIEETNAMMSPPDGRGNFDAGRIICEKSFEASIDMGTEKTVIPSEIRVTAYRHDLPRGTEK